MSQAKEPLILLSPANPMLASYLAETGGEALCVGSVALPVESAVLSKDGRRPDAVVLISGVATARDDRDLFDSLMRVERAVETLCAGSDIPLTIIRPGYMFGDGVEGQMAGLFEEVRSGRYIHLRGNDARLSVICALDVARAAVALAGKPGVFNAADGHDPRLIEIAEAMSANLGARKRMWHLPPAWAKWLGKLPGLGGAGQLLDAARFERRSRSHTLDAASFIEAVGFQPYDTLAVIAREEPSYPYRND